MRLEWADQGRCGSSQTLKSAALRGDDTNLMMITIGRIR